MRGAGTDGRGRGFIRGRLGWALAVLAACLPACESTSVVAVPVSSIEVSPPDAVLLAGNVGQFSATLREEGGAVLSGRTITWSVRDPSVATVGETGLVQAIAPGTTDVVASSGGVEGSSRLTVVPGPAIELDRTGITFTAPLNGPDPFPETVTVTNGGGGTLTELGTAIEYDPGASGWLIANLIDDRAPTALTLQASVSQLQQGNYRAEVAVTSPRAANSPRVVTVDLVVGEALPLIRIEGGTVFGVSGTSGSTAPATIVVDIFNGGGGVVSGLSTQVVYSSAGSDWLAADLSSTSATPSESSVLTLTADPALLQPGIYGATVRVLSANAANSPQAIEITFTVS